MDKDEVWTKLKQSTAFARVLFSALSPREIKVVRSRVGLENGTPMTLGEIGDIMGITRERVRQIEERAIGKMKRIIDIAKN